MRLSWSLCSKRSKVTRPMMISKICNQCRCRTRFDARLCANVISESVGQTLMLLRNSMRLTIILSINASSTTLYGKCLRNYILRSESRRSSLQYSISIEFHEIVSFIIHLLRLKYAQRGFCFGFCFVNTPFYSRVHSVGRNEVQKDDDDNSRVTI